MIDLSFSWDPGPGLCAQVYPRECDQERCVQRVGACGDADDVAILTLRTDGRAAITHSSQFNSSIIVGLSLLFMIEAGEKIRRDDFLERLGFVQGKPMNLV